jgi:hypothetical protein
MNEMNNSMLIPNIPKIFGLPSIHSFQIPRTPEKKSKIIYLYLIYNSENLKTLNLIKIEDQNTENSIFSFNCDLIKLEEDEIDCYFKIVSENNLKNEIVGKSPEPKVTNTMSSLLDSKKLTAICKSILKIS